MNKLLIIGATLAAAMQPQYAQLQQGKDDRKGAPATADQAATDDSAKAGDKAADTTAAAPAAGDQNLNDFAAMGNRQDPGANAAASVGGIKPQSGDTVNEQRIATRVASIQNGGIDVGGGALRDFLTKLAATNPEAVENVTILVPEQFRLTLDNGATIIVEKGVQTVSRYVAEHKWSRGHGVRNFDPKQEEVNSYLDSLPALVAQGVYDEPDYPIYMLEKKLGRKNVTPAMRQRVMDLFKNKAPAAD